MTANHNFNEANISQNVRDHDARQLRTDFLAETFKALSNMTRASCTRTVERVQIYIQA
jgi:hypothetical protein